MFNVVLPCNKKVFTDNCSSFFIYLEEKKLIFAVYMLENFEFG